jgi:transcriptional regulator with XRE-family HTH domain
VCSSSKCKRRRPAVAGSSPWTRERHGPSPPAWSVFSAIENARPRPGESKYVRPQTNRIPRVVRRSWDYAQLPSNRMTANMFDRQRFGQRLQKAIDKADIRKVRLAGELKLDPSRISEWIHGKQVPSVQQLPTLARLLHTDLHWLITGHPAPTGPTDALVEEAVRAAPVLQALAERADALADVPGSL